MDLVTFTDEILHGKLLLLCSVLIFFMHLGHYNISLYTTKRQKLDSEDLRDEVLSIAENWSKSVLEYKESTKKTPRMKANIFY